MSDLVEREGTGETRSWRVSGMDCPSCVAKIEKAVSRIAGVQDVSVNLMAETLTARLGPGGDPASISRAVAALGYEASPQADPRRRHDPCCEQDHGLAAANEDDEAGASWWRTGKARLVWLLTGLIASAWLGARLFPTEAQSIFAAATLLAVLPLGRRALALARAGSPFSIETLMCIAAIGAVIIGAAEEAAIVVLLFAIGELLENVAAGRARAGIKALGSLMPRTARVERDGAVAKVSADALRPGDLVQVRPGDRIPCDGMIVEGLSAVDESPVTGGERAGLARPWRCGGRSLREHGGTPARAGDRGGVGQHDQPHRPHGRGSNRLPRADATLYRKILRLLDTRRDGGGGAGDAGPAVGLRR